MTRYLDATPGAMSDSIANQTGSLDAVVSTKNGLVIISALTFNNRTTHVARTKTVS
jgi:hypothetical protein